MSKNKITAVFSLFSFLAVLVCTAISKILQILFMWAASDVTAPTAIAHVCYYGSDFFSLCSIALAISSTVYAFAYFGRKTAVKTSIITLGCLAFGKVIMYVYNLLANTLSAAQLISGALSYLVEILFDSLVLIFALIFSSIFAKKRDMSKNENSSITYSPLKAAFATCGAYYFALILDLSLMNVVPFLIKYSDPTISEIKKIIADYLFYIYSAAISLLLILLFMYILKKITGKLRLKHFYKAYN